MYRIGHEAKFKDPVIEAQRKMGAGPGSYNHESIKNVQQLAVNYKFGSQKRPSLYPRE